MCLRCTPPTEILVCSLWGLLQVCWASTSLVPCERQRKTEGDFMSEVFPLWPFIQHDFIVRAEKIWEKQAHTSTLFWTVLECIWDKSGSWGRGAKLFLLIIGEQMALLHYWALCPASCSLVTVWKAEHSSYTKGVAIWIVDF